MKTLIVAALVLAACARDIATATSTDGGAVCGLADVECVAKVCPNGFDIVASDYDGFTMSHTKVLRCKP